MLWVNFFQFAGSYKKTLIHTQALVSF